MSPSPVGKTALASPLRVWPGVSAVAAQWLAMFVLPKVFPDTIYLFLGGLACVLLVVIWWLFFSRASWLDRIGALALIAVAFAVTSRFVDRSIANGMMGMMFMIYSIPLGCLVLASGAVVGRRMETGPRRLAIAGAVLAGCALWTAIRTNGESAKGSELAWRWTPTPEERLLAKPSDLPPASPASSVTPVVRPAPKPEAAAVLASANPVATAVPNIPDWPGFRGPLRDGVVRGVRIKADWSVSPPPLIWKRLIGPAWSSVAVHSGLLYTQEQRGASELVSCYRAATGEPVWSHADAVRFWESNAGPGPRATPTVSGERVFTLGATGILNALNAANGASIWSRNVAVDTAAKVPEWGFSGSPVVVDSLVIVAASSHLAAYDTATGEPRWHVKSAKGSYSSPHLLNLAGVPQIVLLSDAGAIAFSPADGKELWRHSWEGTPMLQPALTADNGLLLTTASMSGGSGTRRIALAKGAAGWSAEERWTSRGLKPYFSDLVVHKGHAYGFDGNILSCINLEDGARKWKGGRYGNGQMLLVADQDLLLVVSEDGDIALVSATPAQFEEVGRFHALEGKTWNHPVLTGDMLLVRNGQEMAAFRITRQ